MSGNSSIKQFPRTSIVVMTGKMADGREVVQELPIPHDAGVQEAMIILAAINSVRATGGLMTDGDRGSVDFFPMILFAKGLNFYVKRVSLAIAPSAIQ